MKSDQGIDFMYQVDGDPIVGLIIVAVLILLHYLYRWAQIKLNK
jgi:hypothetical protein